MTERVKSKLEFLLKAEYRKKRVNSTLDVTEGFNKYTPVMRYAKLFALCLKEEKPVLYGEDLFGFNRYNAKTPADDTIDYCKNPECGITLWRMGNMTFDFETVLRVGIDGLKAMADERYEEADEKGKEFYDALYICFEACADIVSRYRQKARETGNHALADALAVVPMRGASSYYEALVTLRFLQFAIRLDNADQVTLGRFDRYMKPYYDISKSEGVSDDRLLELTELFFISLNIDTDLYTGIQQGDNGQSMVLAGCDREGNELGYEIASLALRASEELKIIDPKINLRVNKNTPLSLYEMGTRLTKQGLGFPQYCNDDIAIPALIKWGYTPEDARDYSVAACWEFIASGNAADIPNIAVMNFPLCVERALKSKLGEASNMAEILNEVKKEIEAECDALEERTNKINFYHQAFSSAFVKGCIEKGRDTADGGAEYNNSGVHGVGISNAADSLCAIEHTVFEKKMLSGTDILSAMENNFAGCEQMRRILLDCPKMGNNDDRADKFCEILIKTFAKALEGRKNNRGGIFRAGTGSAMEYLWSADRVGALPDGRLSGQPFACSFSPSLTARTNGVLSAVQSFSKVDLSVACNGGPFTIEIHDTVFRNEEGEKKVAQLIKTFIDLGGHQMQINAINRDRLIDAQKHPERYPNLIVRVWGWSGYFNELDIGYQDHIIKRAEYKL